MTLHPSRLAVLLAAALLAALCAPAGAALATAGAVSSERRLAPGVVHRTLLDPTGPFASHVVQVEPGTDAALDTALAQGRLEGLETTSSMAARHRALVAVNGDFFLPSGRPVHPFAEDGRLLQAPMSGGGTGLRATGRDGRARLGTPRPTMRVSSPTTGFDAPLARLNSGHPTLDELALFTPEAGALEQAPGHACTARLRPWGRPHRGLTGSTSSYVVEQASCGEQPVPARGGTLLSAPNLGQHAGAVSRLPVGATVRVTWTFGWPHVTDLLGANGLQLLDGGQVNPSVDGPDPFLQRQPRTGVGVTASGQTLLVVVDGRQPGYSVGMTLREFAEHLRALGSQSAVLLDGGGSSAMVIEGRVVNRPSDGAERPVANALLVTGRADAWQAVPFRPTRDLARRSADAGRRELADPGSTGGFAQVAQGRGLPLPAELASPAPSAPPSAR